MYWRNTDWIKKVYSLCRPIMLPEGLLVSHHLDIPVEHVSSAVYRQLCYKNAIPMMNTNMGLVVNTFLRPLPIVQHSWQEFTRHGSQGLFSYSVVLVVYLLLILAVVTWFLTLFVLTNYTIKPLVLLKLSTLLLLVYFVVTVVRSIVELHLQQRMGFLQAPKLLDSMNLSNVVNIIDLVVVILLQINQVQIIMRIFLRQKDKRMAFYVGVVASASSQVIWAVMKFRSFPKGDEAADILPAFTYLMRIAMSVCYATLITAFLFLKIRLIAANRGIWLLLILMLVFVYSPVAFFVADVSSAWVYEMLEVFSVVTYVICVVIPWEWCNRFNLIMRVIEKEGVLGRRFYEDELYELDRHDIFMEDPTTALDPSESHSSGSQEPATIRKAVLYAMNTFAAFTDSIIATGLSIPRSVSASTPDQNVPTEFQRTAGTGPLDPTSSNIRNLRRDVFVYTRKEVVVDFSDHERD